MTTYNAAAVADAVIAYEKGITLQQGRALRDNPLAVAEMATGTPIQLGIWHPYDATETNDGNLGEIYDSATDGTVATVVTPNFDDGYEYKLIFAAVSPSNTGVYLRWQFYQETTAAYTSYYVSTPSVAAGETISGWVEILSPRRSSTLQLHDVAIVRTTAFERSVQGTALATSEKVLRARISFDAGNIDGGKIYLHRRRHYA